MTVYSPLTPLLKSNFTMYCNIHKLDILTIAEFPSTLNASSGSASQIQTSPSSTGNEGSVLGDVVRSVTFASFVHNAAVKELTDKRCFHRG